jgi:hypothetical protein
MDVKDLADEKKRLSAALKQTIREFEQKTGLVVIALKPTHDGRDDLCNDVEIKAELQ